jgi:hypothetical protein
MIRNLTLAATVAAIASIFVLATTTNAGGLALSAATPTGEIMASQLTDLGPGTADGNRNFTDNGGPAGQTFKVTVAGMASRFTFKGRGESSGGWNNGPIPFSGTEIWGFQLASVDLGTGALTVLATETATGFIADTNITDYLTFTLTTPVNLTVGPTYAFSLYTSGAGGPGTEGGWFGLANAGADVYADGYSFNNNSSNVNNGNNSDGPRRDFPAPGFAAVVPAGYDHVFAVQSVPPNLPPGDVNGDLLVNSTDYGIIKSNFFAAGATRGMGDLSGDGRVSLADFTIWRNLVSPAIAASVGVPEPSSLALAAGAVGLIAVRARRDRRRR